MKKTFNGFLLHAHVLRMSLHIIFCIELIFENEALTKVEMLTIFNFAIFLISII